MIRILCLFAVLLPASLSADELPVPIQNLSTAIRLQTVSHQDPAQFDAESFNQFIAFLEQTYPNVHESLEVTRIAEFSLLFKWQGTAPSMRPVLMDAHYDVVPVEPGTEDDWDFEPFSGEVRDGFLLGRGSIDDKSPALSTFEALESLLEEGYQPARTLYYSLGHDEEIGGRNGAANIARYFEDEGVTFEFMLGEGGMVVGSHPMLPGQTIAMVNLAQKGYLTLTLSTEGQGGHSSAPTENNSLVKLAEAVSQLHHNPFEPKLVSPVTDMLEVLGEHADGMVGFVLNNQWLTEPLLISQMDEGVTRSMVRTTTAVTMFNSGVKENVIPQRAEAKVNFRLLPGDTKESLIASVKAIIDDPGVEVTAGDWNVIPRVADRNAIGYQKIIDAVNEAMPEAIVVPGLLIATTDTRHYEDLVDEVYHFQPFFIELEEAGGIHGTNEKVRVESYLASIELNEAVIRSITTP